MAVMFVRIMWVHVAQRRMRMGMHVRLGAFAGRVFEGTVTAIGASVDPNTRRVVIRSEITVDMLRRALPHTKESDATSQP